jgi:hypothetical protein
MMKAKFNILSLFLISASLYSQQIENVDFSVNNNTLTVTYDLVHCPPRKVYDIRLKFVDENGQETSPVTLTGDIRKVVPGKNKKIEWNALNDLSGLKGNVKAVVEITVTRSTEITGGPSCAFASMLLPGLGDYLVNQKEYNAKNQSYYITLLFGGAALYTWAFKVSSDKDYSTYNNLKTQFQNQGSLNTISQSSLDDSKRKANSEYNTFLIMAGVTTTIWLADVIHVAIKGTKNKRKQLGMAYSKSPNKFYFICNGNNYGIGLLRNF